MPTLVLGPLLRYTGSTQATVWVETDAPCEVAVLGARQRTFCVEGHHYALVVLSDLDEGSVRAYEVAPRRRARVAAGRRPAAARRSTRASTSATRASSSAPAASAIRSARPYTLAPTASAGLRHRRALGALAAAAVRSARSGPTACCCSATRSTPTRPPRRHGSSSARAATRAGRPASRSPTSRSTRGSTARRGATPTSAGCSRRCPAR